LLWPLFNHRVNPVFLLIQKNTVRQSLHRLRAVLGFESRISFTVAEASQISGNGKLARDAKLKTQNSHSYERCRLEMTLNGGDVRV
jgi:hypothetical protein